MAKLIIDNSELANAFFEDARLAGIQCPAETHRFIWMINRQFGYHFLYLQNEEIRLKSQNRDYHFPVYYCAEPNLEIEHFLYVNKSDGKHLLPELKHIDFLWLVKGDARGEPLFEDLMKILRTLDPVQLVMELTNENIKNKEHLVF
jgi:hypothetical protein